MVVEKSIPGSGNLQFGSTIHTRGIANSTPDPMQVLPALRCKVAQTLSAIG